MYGDATGAIYVSDQANHRVQKYTPSNQNGVTAAGGNGSGSAANQLNNPHGIHVDAAGNLYVVDSENHRVQKWAPGATSGVTVAGGNVSGDAENQLNSPTAVVVDAQGYITVSDKKITAFSAGARAPLPAEQ